ncbi:MAG: fluoride efflux transporter CrcB [Betaproteobacteria bacterium]|jgi:CrcB protein|nr:fluoride efflux transporter CrcB [Betaproteobacteria bacterium]
MSAVIAICIGACVGALARWQLSVHFNQSGMLPWGTLYANLIGGYLIGLCVATFQHLPELDPVWRLLLVTGFLGALTTFSSFSSEVVQMLINSRYGMALLTSAMHLFGSLLLTLAGIKTIEWLWAR